MKKILKFIGIILLLLIAFVLISGLFVPKTYRMEKSILINAPREKVWSNVNSLQKLAAWSPWAVKDPNMKVQFEGKEGAVGSMYKWEGNKNVGAGSQSISRIDVPNQLETKLHFIKPFEGNADAFINLKDSANGTKASWGFQTRYAYPMNVMLLFVNMDEMMGKEYHAGLTKLKRISESQ